jgi:hypothetical protein
MGSFTLNFNEDRLITGANIVDNVLYFTDNHTEPKRINLDVFKAADHSNGTTSVYGRQFLERDITVIRPHPQAVINSKLSGEISVPIDADEPTVVTGIAQVFNDFVRLNGTSVNAGTEFVKRGFYYYESSTLPTLQSLIASGIKVESDLNGFYFSEDIDSLGDDKQYYYVAYAKSQVGSAIYGDIVKFKTNALTTDFPSVTTVGHEKISNLSYKLKGKVTDNGGSDIIEVGMYYYFLNFLNGSAAPSTLVGNFNNPIENAFKRQATYDTLTGEFEISIPIPPQTIFYYQAYAVNAEDGQDEGLVKNQMVAVTEAPALEMEESDIYATKAILRARVTRPNGTLVDRGFYFSKTSNNLFTMVAQHSTNSNIFKVSTGVGPNNVLDIFSYDTIAESGLTLARGDTLYVAAYADNGTENQTGITALTIRDADTSVEPPSVRTESVVITDSSGNSKIQCTGYNSAAGWQSVDKLGFYITRVESGVSLGIDQEAKKAEMIRRYNAAPQTATEVISNRVSGFITQPNTDPGLYMVSFGGDNVIPIESGYDYYAMAIASSNGTLGYGDVLSTPVKADASAPPVYTHQTTSVTQTSGKFSGLVEYVNDPAIKQDLDDAGFTYAATGSNLKVAHISISSGDLTSLNTFVTTGVGDGNFSVNKTSLQNNTEYKVQAYVTPSGGSKVYATFDNDRQGTYGDGITKFKTLKPSPSLPKISVSLTDTGRTTATVRGNLLTDGNSDMTLYDMVPNFYYAKKSLTTGSNDDQRRANIITLVGSNAASADKGKLIGDWSLESVASGSREGLNEVFRRIGGAAENVISSTGVPLANDTEYYFFMVTTVSNGSTSSESFGGLGAGKAISNLGLFKTLEPEATVPIVGQVSMRTINETNAWVEVNVLSDGGNNDWQGIKHGFYYIKKSDLPSNYDPNNGLTAASNLIADADKTFVYSRFGGGSYMGAKNLTDLEPDTEYYVIAAVENEVGIGYSNKATLFKTNGGVEVVPDSLDITGEKYLTFDKYGRAHDDNTILYSITPSSAKAIVSVSDWQEARVILNVTRINIREERTSSGAHLITLNVPTNYGGARTAYVTFTHPTSGIIRKVQIGQEAGSRSYISWEDDQIDLAF